MLPARLSSVISGLVIAAILLLLPSGCGRREEDQTFVFRGLVTKIHGNQVLVVGQRAQPDAAPAYDPVWFSGKHADTLAPAALGTQVDVTVKEGIQESYPGGGIAEKVVPVTEAASLRVEVFKTVLEACQELDIPNIRSFQYDEASKVWSVEAADELQKETRHYQVDAQLTMTRTDAGNSAAH